MIRIRVSLIRDDQVIAMTFAYLPSRNDSPLPLSIHVREWLSGLEFPPQLGDTLETEVLS